jgi:hypothetical protein
MNPKRTEKIIGNKKIVTTEFFGKDKGTRKETYIKDKLKGWVKDSLEWDGVKTIKYDKDGNQIDNDNFKDYDRGDKEDQKNKITSTDKKLMDLDYKIEELKEDIKKQCIKEGLIEETDEDKEKDSLLEQLSAIEHEQWMKWAGDIIDVVPPELKYKWKRNMKPYQDLTEEVKEMDREWARKIIDIIENQKDKGNK